MNNSKVSIIIPVYNVERYVEKCISSIINQTYKNLEILIINDGSTDSSYTICKKFAEIDERIKLFNQKNSGVSVARNVGIENASGEWIYFIDSDDYLDIDAIENIIYQANGADVIQFGFRKIKNGEVIKVKYSSKYLVVKSTNEILNNLEIRPLSACLHFIKNKVIINNNIKFPEDLRYNEDMEFMYRVYFNSEHFLFLNKSFYNIVLSDNSATRSPMNLLKINSKLVFINRMINLFKEYDISENSKNECNKFLKSYFVSIEKYNGSYKDFKLINRNYRAFYLDNTGYIDSFFAKIAFIDVRIVSTILKIKHIFF